MTKILIKKKWINATESTFSEDGESSAKKYHLTSLIVPFNKISRNGVLYSKESIERTYKNIENRNLHHNHEINGASNFPRGKWQESWLADDGMHARAEIYDTDYNKDYIEWLKADKNPQVSLQITGEAESVKGEDGKYFQKAEINDWLEVSTVNVPGFLQAQGSFESVLSEALKQKEEDEEAIELKVGDDVKTRNGKGKLVNIVGNQGTIDTGDTEITANLDDIWLSEENFAFFEQLNSVRESIKESQDGKLVFSDAETAEQAKKILEFSMDVDYVSGKKNALFVQDKSMAKAILIRKGMKGIQNQ